MPKEHIYTIKDLIRVYIETQKRNHIHIDFTNYYSNLLEALQKAFNIILTSSEGLEFKKRGLHMLFRATVHSLIALRTPWSGFLEASLIVRQLEEAGTVGEHIQQLSNSIDTTNKQSERLHEEMLEVLFNYLYHPHRITITSQQLGEQGFDDATEPNISDYWDYY